MPSIQIGSSEGAVLGPVAPDSRGAIAGIPVTGQKIDQIYPARLTKNDIIMSKKGKICMTIPKNRRGATRRDCLKLGLGALCGAGFVDLLRLQSKAAGESTAVARSVILIWM